MASTIYHRVKIIPSPEDSTSRNGRGNNHNDINKKFPIAIQFALHGLVKNSNQEDDENINTSRTDKSSSANNNNNQNLYHGNKSNRALLGAAPPGRTLFFCIASAHLFPTAEAMSHVCADPSDFARICARHGRGAEVPRPDFVSGYTRALPVAQYHQTQNQPNCKNKKPKPDDEGDDDKNISENSDVDDDEEKNIRSRHTAARTKPRWVFVAEARCMISEQMMSSLLGETTQRFVVLFTSAYFDRSNSSANGEIKMITSGNSSTDITRNNFRFGHAAGAPFAQPLVEIQGDYYDKNATNGRNNNLRNFDANQTSKGKNKSSLPSSPKLTREECVSFCELTPELTSTNLNVILGPHDRSWLFRFDQSDEQNNNNNNNNNKDKDIHLDQQLPNANNNNKINNNFTLKGIPRTMLRHNNNGNNRRLRDPFDAARQLCTHRMHLGDQAMLREMAKRFNEFLIGSTQDCRRFCSFQAARMKIPIVFEQGMRSAQCQAFLQFLRQSRQLVSDTCIPEPPPHLAAHTIPPEFLEEKPLLEVIADLSVRFNNNDKHQDNNRNKKNNHDQEEFDAGGDDDDVDFETWRRNHFGENNEDEETQKVDENDRQSKNQRQQQRLLPHEQQGYYGPEVRSAFAPWRIEWLDYLLLVCAETRLWREISVLTRRFYELTDSQLLKHPEYNHEETSFRINLFANAADIEAATGYPFDLSDAVRIAHRCSRFCKASATNRALVFRIRHMTNMPHVQRILFDPSICMFEELIGSGNESTNVIISHKVTLGKILWCLLVPLRLQQHVTAVIGSRDNGVKMVTTPKVAARQFRSFVLCSSIGDDAFKALTKKRFNGWVQLIRERRVKRKQALQLQMTVRHSMVQNMDSRKAFYLRWFQHTLRTMKLRKQGKIPPRAVSNDVCREELEGEL